MVPGTRDASANAANADKAANAALHASGPLLALRPHATVATLLDGDRTRLVAALAGLPPGTDLAEVRLDALWPKVPDADRATDDLLALTDAADAAAVRLLATLRPRRQGGRFDGPEDVRLSLLQAALRAGFAAADLEMDGLDMAGEVRAFRPAGDVVLSVHLGGEAPCRSDGLQPLLAMHDLGAAYDKLAFTASAFPDLLRALELARAHHLRGGRPAVSTMVHGGAAVRALMPLAGNRASYGHAPGLAPAVPGQPALADIEATWDQWGLTRSDLDQCAAGDGQWLAVLGTPVAHSQSPRLHNAWLRTAGRRERFGALDVPASASALRLVFHASERIGLVGASITAPHKLDAARIAECDAAAKAIGAANCVRMEPGGRVVATNTDASAVERLAKPHVASGSSVLVLGSGGFARAATHALKRLGAHVTVADRSDAKAATFHALGATLIPWADRAKVHADAIVQATPLTDASVLPATALAHRPWVLEAVYAGGPTALQRAAASAGCVVTDGLQLLEAQGRDAYRFWFGAEAP
ncbi:MAG: type I 3-dehydroquinate dehydratase [Candidatus Thermoplasmatota archaeon]